MSHWLKNDQYVITHRIDKNHQEIAINGIDIVLTISHDSFQAVNEQVDATKPVEGLPG